MRKKFLATIVAVGLVAVAAFAGANGLTETQAACEHSQVRDGACVDCNDPVGWNLFVRSVRIVRFRYMRSVVSMKNACYR